MSDEQQPSAAKVLQWKAMLFSTAFALDAAGKRKFRRALTRLRNMGKHENEIVDAVLCTRHHVYMLNQTVKGQPR